MDSQVFDGPSVIMNSFLSDDMKIIIVVKMADGRVKYASPGALKIYGYSKDEFSRIYVSDLAPSVKKIGWKNYKKIVTSPRNGPLSIQTSHIKKNGQKFPVRVTPRICNQHGTTYIVAEIDDWTTVNDEQAGLIERERLFGMKLANTLCLDQFRQFFSSLYILVTQSDILKVCDKMKKVAHILKEDDFVRKINEKQGFREHLSKYLDNIAHVLLEYSNECSSSAEKYKNALDSTYFKEEVGSSRHCRFEIKHLVAKLAKDKNNCTVSLVGCTQHTPLYIDGQQLSTALGSLLDQIVEKSKLVSNTGMRIVFSVKEEKLCILLNFAENIDFSFERLFSFGGALYRAGVAFNRLGVDFCHSTDGDSTTIQLKGIAIRDTEEFTICGGRF